MSEVAELPSVFDAADMAHDITAPEQSELGEVTDDLLSLGERIERECDSTIIEDVGRVACAGCPFFDGCMRPQAVAAREMAAQQPDAVEAAEDVRSDEFGTLTPETLPLQPKTSYLSELLDENDGIVMAGYEPVQSVRPHRPSKVPVDEAWWRPEPAVKQAPARELDEPQESSSDTVDVSIIEPQPPVITPGIPDVEIAPAPVMTPDMRPAAPMTLEADLLPVTTSDIDAAMPIVVEADSAPVANPKTDRLPVKTPEADPLPVAAPEIDAAPIRTAPAAQGDPLPAPTHKAVAKPKQPTPDSKQCQVLTDMMPAAQKKSIKEIPENHNITQRYNKPKPIYAPVKDRENLPAFDELTAIMTHLVNPVKKAAAQQTEASTVKKPILSRPSVETAKTEAKIVQKTIEKRLKAKNSKEQPLEPEVTLNPRRDIANVVDELAAVPETPYLNTIYDVKKNDLPLHEKTVSIEEYEEIDKTNVTAREGSLPYREAVGVTSSEVSTYELSETNTVAPRAERMKKEEIMPPLSYIGELESDYDFNLTAQETFVVKSSPAEGDKEIDKFDDYITEDAPILSQLKHEVIELKNKYEEKKLRKKRSKVKPEASSDDEGSPESETPNHGYGATWLAQLVGMVAVYVSLERC